MSSDATDVICFETVLRTVSNLLPSQQVAGVSVGLARSCVKARGVHNHDERNEMKRMSSWTRWSTVIAAAAALGIPAAVSNAQTPNPVGFGVLVGATIPVGSFSDGSSTGWHAGGLLEWNSPALPVGFRGDVVYHQLGGKDFTSGNTTVTSKAKMIAGTANVVWMFPMDNGASMVRPYLIGGVGIYHVTFEGTCTGTCISINTSSDSETKFGLNGGAGAQFDLSGFSTFVEARYHTIRTSCETGGGTCSSNMVPISVGIIFR